MENTLLSINVFALLIFSVNLVKIIDKFAAIYPKSLKVLFKLSLRTIILLSSSIFKQILNAIFNLKGENLYLSHNLSFKDSFWAKNYSTLWKLDKKEYKLYGLIQLIYLILMEELKSIT